LSTLHLDITSKSKVFNSLLPQGNSYFHKFGKRNYPISDLNLSKIIRFLSSSSLDKVFCNSFYGDSLTHPKIDFLATKCKTFEKELLVFTHGSEVDMSVLKGLKSKNVTIYLNLYGAFDSANLVTQNLNWNYIEKLVQYYQEKLIIEYHIFKQNLSDIDPLIDLCLKNNVTLNFKKHLNSGYESIFDSEGNWLYDLNSIENDYKNTFDIFLNNEDLLKYKNKFKVEDFKLQKSVQGFSNLKFYLNNKSLKNIFEITNQSHINESIDIETQEDMYINFLGYIFKNKTLYEVFNQCLCNDWGQDFSRYITFINSFGFENSKQILEDLENSIATKYQYLGSKIFHETSGLRLEFLKIIPYIDFIIKNLEQNKLPKLS
tara:strand:- start:210 stop:1331 length:1122 start_codon:yes stop_codon:yes gene_type:complete